MISDHLIQVKSKSCITVTTRHLLNITWVENASDDRFATEMNNYGIVISKMYYIYIDKRERESLKFFINIDHRKK